MTRAKDRLYLVHAHHRSTWGVGAMSEPSRFLAELPQELLSAERGAAPSRRRWGGRRGVDDDGDWLPGGYRAPRRSPRNEPLRPVSLPDLSAPPASRAGRALDAARERVAGTAYGPGEELEMGSGAFEGGAERSGAGAAADEPGTVAWRAGDHVRHRRFGEGIVVSSKLVKGDEEVTVAFVGQGVKRLIAAYAGLERE